MYLQQTNLFLFVCFNVGVWRWSGGAYLGNWSKRRQTETSTTKTSTNQNADKPKRRQTKTSTDQNVDKPKRRQTKRRQAKTSTNLNVDTPFYYAVCYGVVAILLCCR